jgi:xanthine dehydrogenase accessory factor
MRDTSRFVERLAALQRDRQVFAVATVVARRAPVSAHLGDRAIVYPDGRMEGFVGGACSREIVRTQALQALAVRQARLVCIRPEPAESQESSAERVVVRMTCASEGAVDVYVEPNGPPRALVVVGATPIAHALTKIARAMDYDVTRVVDAGEERDVAGEAAEAGARLAPIAELATLVRDLDAREGFIVVASQGHYDEQALEAVLASDVDYVALVASKKRGESVRAALEASNAAGRGRLRNPAGLDLGGRSAPDVALSILAEIVQLRSGVLTTPPRSTYRPASDARLLAMAGPATGTAATDPVCHMEVETTGAAHTADVDGVTYYFCCGGCKAKFVKDPQRYLSTTS